MGKTMCIQTTNPDDNASNQVVSKLNSISSVIDGNNANITYLIDKYIYIITLIIIIVIIFLFKIKLQ